MLYSMLKQLEREARTKGCAYMLVLRNRGYGDNFVVGVMPDENLKEKKAYYSERNELVDVIKLSDENLD